jgi:hypothetical protein
MTPHKFRTAAVLVLLAATMLCMTFPFYSYSVKFPTGVEYREEFGPRFFAMGRPENADTQLVKYAERHFDRWQIDWSRTIHSMLLLSSVSVGVLWVGLAIWGPGKRAKE